MLKSNLELYFSIHHSALPISEVRPRLRQVDLLLDAVQHRLAVLHRRAIQPGLSRADDHALVVAVERRGELHLEHGSVLPNHHVQPADATRRHAERCGEWHVYAELPRRSDID